MFLELLVLVKAVLAAICLAAPACKLAWDLSGSSPVPLLSTVAHTQ